jgi:hypothetical protein
MFGFFKRTPPEAPPAKKGYRALPASIPHPSRARRFTPEEFASTEKKQMQDAPSTCAGHMGTTVWYVDGFGYIVEVRFDSHPSVYAHSICTFTPTFGIDRIDGEFAQDVEEFLLGEVLGVKSRRLEVFQKAAEVSTVQYLRVRGFIK